jgi:hypothetical protein
LRASTASASLRAAKNAGDVASVAAARFAIARRHHAHVDRHVLVRADAANRARLEHAQQQRLERQRHLADLVEEHRAAGRALERADAVGIGAGERAAQVAKQLRLGEVVRQRAAVDDDERLVAPRAGVVDRLGDQLLAVPLSPTISTVALLRPHCSMIGYSLRISALAPRIGPNWFVAASGCSRS